MEMLTIIFALVLVGCGVGWGFLIEDAIRIERQLRWGIPPWEPAGQPLGLLARCPECGCRDGALALSCDTGANVLIGRA